MLEGSLWDKIIVFALPIALTGILEQMFNAADVAVLGRFVGTEAMAAVGNNVPIVGLIVTLFLGLSLGANVVIAQYIGARRLKEASRAVHTALALSLLAGIGVTLLGELFVAPLLSLLSVPDAVMPLAELYLRVFLMGMPFMSVYNFASAILRSHGDTGTPLIALLAASALNVVLDLRFVLVLGLSADGVAWGTVLSDLGAGPPVRGSASMLPVVWGCARRRAPWIRVLISTPRVASWRPIATDLRSRISMESRDVSV